MRLIVGLGNPGNDYRNNRHNIGFMAIDAIASEHGFPAFKKKYKGLFSDGKIAGERVLLLKPQTFMNRSGASVAALASFFKIAPKDIIVFYDELDLVAGKVRVKTGGGNGGHNGLRSIDPVIGKEYKRVRLGIGRPAHKAQVTKYVLGDFAKSDNEWLEKLLEAAAQNVGLLLDENDAQFMNKMALAVNGEKQEKKQKTKKPNKNITLTIEEKPTPTNKMADMLKKLIKRD